MDATPTVAEAHVLGRLSLRLVEPEIGVVIHTTVWSAKVKNSCGKGGASRGRAVSVSWGVAILELLLDPGHSLL